MLPSHASLKMDVNKFCIFLLFFYCFGLLCSMTVESFAPSTLTPLSPFSVHSLHSPLPSPFILFQCFLQPLCYCPLLNCEAVCGTMALCLSCQILGSFLWPVMLEDAEVSLNCYFLHSLHSFMHSTHSPLHSFLRFTFNTVAKKYPLSVGWVKGLKRNCYAVFCVFDGVAFVCVCVEANLPSQGFWQLYGEIFSQQFYARNLSTSLVTGRTIAFCDILA